ncbi:LysR family transcriptional regulator [Telmatospirillum sp. J64-1]|uniref:LysR family transcriptional regulator n=1 Tax=Telmatospirillum sp. J64-1 TaxID=2502183 RepID=UPI00115F560C|nr:LysR family transcriptional regulator [Telmatospirillum sp. J64-1]
MHSPKMPELNTKRLYQFQILAELGSAGKACAFLGISQPALTQSINRLETDLNAVLFDRTTRPPRLTISGRHLLQFARKLNLETENLYERLELEQGGQNGIVRLGCGARWMVDIIPRVIGTFSRKYPETRLSVRVAQMDELTELLENRQISLLFGTTTGMKRLMHHQVTPLGTDRFAVVARKGHPLHKRRNIPLQDLLQEKWIIGDPGTSSTMVLRQVLREANLTMIHPAVEMSDTLSVANTMRNGDFIGIFTTATVRNLADIEELSVDFALPESSSGAIHLSDHALSDIEQALIEEVKAAFGGHGGGI